jgi:D-alanine-D-alanine ligase
MKSVLAGQNEMNVTKTNTTDFIPGRVGVLMGGQSAEREISLLSGKAVLAALQSQGVDAIGIDVDSDIVAVLRDNKIDHVFNILHGRGGEDGKLQGLLELTGIPYTGSGVLASALSMDKIKTKLIWKALGISTPPFQMLRGDSDWQAIIGELQEAVVKPVREGSSIGMSIATTAAELEEAFTRACEFDSEVMAEKRIRGAEFTVAILRGRTLPAIELRTDHVFYDFHAKYIANDTQYLCPAPLSEQKAAELSSLCLRAFEALDCQDWGRVDVMQDQEGRFWLLEINTVPGMTDHSLVPMAAAKVGISFNQLVLDILTAKQK